MLKRQLKSVTGTGSDQPSMSLNRQSIALPLEDVKTVLQANQQELQKIPLQNITQRPGETINQVKNIEKKTVADIGELGKQKAKQFKDAFKQNATTALKNIGTSTLQELQQGVGKMIAKQMGQGILRDKYRTNSYLKRHSALRRIIDSDHFSRRTSPMTINRTQKGGFLPQMGGRHFGLMDLIAHTLTGTFKAGAALSGRKIPKEHRKPKVFDPTFLYKDALTVKKTLKDCIQKYIKR